MNKSKRRNQGRRILVGVATLALGLFGLSGLQRLWLDAPGSARLMSIQDIDETGDSCYRPVSTDSTASPEQSLFSAFEAPSVYAQDVATNEVNRPPVRQLMDTAPTYSSVGVDLAH